MDIELPQDDSELRRVVLRALRNTAIVVIYQDADLKVAWARNVPEQWGGNDIVGRSDEDYLPEAIRERTAELKRKVLASGLQQGFEFHDGPAGESRWFRMWIDLDVDATGTAAGVVTTLKEISEQKHREQTLRTLLREVSHRSKNLLAIILSIATQTGRHSDTVEEFLHRFRGRVQSLASSQDLVTSANWRGVLLSKLIEEQVIRYWGGTKRNLRFAGVDPYLNPNAALHIGLAVHELIVNSARHGALAAPDGEVQISASFEKDGQTMLLVWSEWTAIDSLPEKTRFGIAALEGVVPASLGGTAELSVDGNRLTYRLRVPSLNFAPGDKPEG